MHLDHVARGPRIRRDDRRFATREPIKERRFPGIGRAGNGDHEAVAQALAARAVGERRGDFAAQLLRSMKRRADEIFGHIGLIGKVDPGFDQRQRLDDLPAPRLGPVADHPLELAKRLPALRRRLGGDEVGQALHRREIEAAVLESAAGEFAGLGRTATLDACERLEHRGNDRMAAVQLQLGHVLAGLAVRAGKPKRQRLVDHLPARRIAHPRERRVARRRHTADEPLQRPARLRTANAHHRDRRRRPAGRERENGVVGSHAGRSRQSRRPRKERSRRPGRRRWRALAGSHSFDG